MKPVDVSDRDWERALLIDAPVNKWDSRMPRDPVHVFLQRDERSCYIYLLENGCLVRGKYMSMDYDIKEHIKEHIDRYLGVGVFHNLQE